MRLLVVIPSSGLDGMLVVCLGHARRALDRRGAPIDGRILVVDNASDVPYREADLPHVDRLLRFDEHRSFSAACNAAVAAEPSDLVLLLNNDVLLHEDAIADMLALLDDPLVAIVGTRMIFPDGTIQHCGVVFDEHGPFHDRWGERSQIVPRTVRHLQCVTGAALIIRTAVFRGVGGLDEDYVFGFEDVDLCLRVRQHGYRIACAQATDSIHFQSSTPGRLGFEEESQRLYLERWLGRWSADVDARVFHG